MSSHEFSDVLLVVNVVSSFVDGRRDRKSGTRYSSLLGTSKSPEATVVSVGRRIGRQDHQETLTHVDSLDRLRKKRAATDGGRSSRPHHGDAAMDPRATKAREKNYHQYFGEPFVSEGAIGLLRELGRKLTRNEPVAAHRQHVSTLHTKPWSCKILGHERRNQTLRAHAKFQQDQKPIIRQI